VKEWFKIREEKTCPILNKALNCEPPTQQWINTRHQQCTCFYHSQNHVLKWEDQQYRKVRNKFVPLGNKGSMCPLEVYDMKVDVGVCKNNRPFIVRAEFTKKSINSQCQTSESVLKKLNLTGERLIGMFQKQVSMALTKIMRVQKDG